MKLYIIKGNASGIIMRIWTDDDPTLFFYAIFDTQKEAKKVLSELGNAMFHIEKIEANLEDLLTKK